MGHRKIAYFRAMTIAAGSLRCEAVCSIQHDGSRLKRRGWGTARAGARAGYRHLPYLADTSSAVLTGSSNGGAEARCKFLSDLKWWANPAR